MTVLDLNRHPRTACSAVQLPPIDPAEALTAVARNWDRIVDALNSGPDALGDDEAHEAAQVMASALVHPAARPSLVFTLPALLAAVRLDEQVRDGDIDPNQIADDCRTLEHAREYTEHAVRCELYPLLHGLPLRDACLRCTHLIADVTRWPTRRGCDAHGKANAEWSS
jgi:hypothetical protein